MITKTFNGLEYKIETIEDYLTDMEIKYMTGNVKGRENKMITDNYIKMCEQAGEIQKEWKQENGDLVFWKITKSIKIVTDHFFAESFKDFVWLPTQEQLQEMTEGRFHIWGNLNSLTMTASTADRDTHQICRNVDSMNELWLMYVMKEKYNKSWTGDKWEVAE